MKKPLSIVLVVACVSVAHAAQEWKLSSFLNVPSITTSNTYGATNLFSPTFTVSNATNFTGLIITNKALGRVIIGTTTNSDGTYTSQYQNIFSDIPMGPYSLPFAGATNATYQGPVGIIVSVTGGSGANVANTLKFIPVFDESHQATAAATEGLLLAVTPNGATRVTIKTNLLLQTQFHNCKSIRLEWILPGDTDASSQVVWDTIKLIQLGDK